VSCVILPCRDPPGAPYDGRQFGYEGMGRGRRPEGAWVIVGVRRLASEQSLVVRKVAGKPKWRALMLPDTTWRFRRLKPLHLPWSTLWPLPGE
jgi:hypothetical protein